MKKISLVIGSRNEKKTEELIKWCKANKGVLWCKTSKQAKTIHDKHGIKTLSYDKNTLLKGMNKPVALDDFFFHPLIMQFLSYACFQSRGKIEITMDKEKEIFELKMVAENNK